MNIAKLNTVSLDDKTFIIKRGTSGGGSTPDTPSGGGVRSSWRYFDVSKAAFSPIIMTPTIVRYSDPTSITTALNLETGNWDAVKAIGVDGDGIVVVGDKPYTWNEGMAAEGMTPESMAQMNVIEITEEEFLNKTFE